jgi:1-acyl-sn-glycerol-3-phosphate acyltransferase
MKPYPLLWKCAQAVARFLTTLLFDLKVYGRRCVPARGGVLVVSNHQGNLDPVLLGCRMERPMSYLGKSDLFEVHPFCTWLIRSLGGIPVRQGAGDVGAVKETIQRLREGHVLNFYPEGARTKDGEIGPLEKGVALIVRRSGVPVVPAVIVGSFEAWPRKRSVLRPWPIRVRYGPPMDLAGQDSEEIIATIDRTLRDMLEELRGPRPSSPQARLWNGVGADQSDGSND